MRGLTTMRRISSAQALKTALDELQDLLLTDKPALKPSRSSGAASNTKSKSTTSSDPYNRAKYHVYAGDRKAAFLGLYAYCFNLAKPE
jgi:DCN1-like protein 4/5